MVHFTKLVEALSQHRMGHAAHLVFWHFVESFVDAPRATGWAAKASIPAGLQLTAMLMPRSPPTPAQLVIWSTPD
ncbi:hypothetical protein ABTY61_22860 [Kitasatospora sp. NPDC096128]|uniref:hypothetical protein n=1 Tax=Kitasatospora sp. NPDC096128 TaxID=3155547 RepID=UPI0033260004